MPYSSKPEPMSLRRLAVVTIALVFPVILLVWTRRGETPHDNIIDDDDDDDDDTTSPSLEVERTPPPPTPADKALASICFAHDALQALPFVRLAGWPSLTEFIGINVNEAPFAVTTNAENARYAATEQLAKQSRAVLRGWVQSYELLLAGARLETDGGAGAAGAAGGAGGGHQDVHGDNNVARVADIIALVAATLQDSKARALYLHELVPRMQKAGADGVARRFGKGANKVVGRERERRRIMMQWLGD